MSDANEPQNGTPDPASANAEVADRELSPGEIDARHARHLLERALSQLERGDRPAAALACKQAIHLAPNSPLAHSLAGLLGLLDGDLKTAVAAYDKAVPDFKRASTERQRLIALRMAQAENTPLDIAAFVPSVQSEIARLRQSVQAAPVSEFLNVENGAPPEMTAPVAAPLVAPIPAPVTPLDASEPRAPFAKRLESRRRASALSLAAIAVVAGILSFFVARAIFGPKSTPVVNAATNAGSTPEAAAPIENQIENQAANQTSQSVPQAISPAPNAATNTAGSTPAATPAAPAPVPTPIRTSPVLPPPAAPRPAPTARPAPQSTPRPTPTPREPMYPPMPRPNLKLPSAGGEKTEYPRVIPDNGR